MTTLKKVLVVDDDPVVGKSFERVLAPKGFAVIAASCGAEALERIAKEDYDVVYADIRMPEMDGIEVTRRIKAARPWLPVMIVTGYGTDANEAEARKLGVAGFLRKPLSPEMIEDSTHAVPMAATPALDIDLTEQKAEPAVRRAGIGGFLKHLGLLVAGPLLGLAYLVLWPFVGIAIVGYLGFRALTGRRNQSA